MKSYPGEKEGVIFCSRSLVTQGGSAKTQNVATERLTKSDEIKRNLNQCEWSRMKLKPIFICSVF